MTSRGSLTRRGPLRWRVGLPVLISVSVHALILAIAGAYVVREVTSARRPEFAATPAPPERPAEHRVQIARRASGAAAAAANPALARITSAASVAAFALPEPAEPVGLGGSLLGTGMNAAALGVGSGPGLATALGSSGAGGRGLMSLTFLGLTAPRVTRVVFVVDVSRDLMDIRKGGFEAFAVIRNEIVRLVTQLPPTARFGVVLFGAASGDVNCFAAELTLATVAHKEALVAWIRPLNARPDHLGTRSAGAYLGWKERALPRSRAGRLPPAAAVVACAPRSAGARTGYDLSGHRWSFDSPAPAQRRTPGNAGETQRAGEGAPPPTRHRSRDGCRVAANGAREGTARVGGN